MSTVTETTKETPTDAAVEQLAAVGAQYGYSRSRRHPSNTEHILGAKNFAEIINLENTATQLAAAKAFAEKLGREGKTLLFVGGKPEARAAIRQAGESLGQPWSAGRWIGGALTNFAEIRKRIDRLTSLREDRDRGALQKFTKRERLMIDREITRLEENFQGLIALNGRLPDALFVVDSKEEESAVAEGKRLALPIIAVSGSDCDMGDAKYPILANDASRRSIEYFVKEIADAFSKGRGGGK